MGLIRPIYEDRFVAIAWPFQKGKLKVLMQLAASLNEVGGLVEWMTCELGKRITKTSVRVTCAPFTYYRIRRQNRNGTLGSIC